MVRDGATQSFVHPRAQQLSFWFRVVSAGLAALAAVLTFVHFYAIGYSAESEQSVGSAWTLVRKRPEAISEGAYGVFAIDKRVGRGFTPGTLFVKLVVGRPGDLVEVTKGETTVNGKKVAGEMDSLLPNDAPDAYDRTYILGADEYFVVGTRAHSFDSRYWGPVKASQFVGRAWLL